MTTGTLTELLNAAANQTDLTECARQCRQVLISAIDYIFEVTHSDKPVSASLLELIEHPAVAGYIDDADLLASMHYVRILGMNAEHKRNIRKKEAALALENITYIVGLLKAKESGTDAAYHKPPYMSEAATRRLYIDQYLREAGWEILETEHIAQPGKAGIEIEVHGMPNEHGKGYCDYVLYGKDGLPLAIVEVKKTSVSPEKGRHQVMLYGDCMEQQYGRRPVLYYTNGYTTKVIDGSYPDREIHAFHAREELERLIQRRTLGPISDLSIKDEITNRPYQKMAITNICEWLNRKHRRGLLVMATGTGKTRVAISLVDVLARNKWIKNVLFLADRIPLVNQAKRNFAKLLPDMSVCELSAGGERDLNARLIFCTYQTMIHYIDAEDKEFTTGRFDLIIIDEAHRSIFNRYGTIFKYFDSLLIGLTATPRDEVDANTYRIFGCEAGVPNFDYTLNEAVQEKYLVGYHVINRSSKLLKEGIRYADLTEEEKEQLDDYLPDDTPAEAYDISASELFMYLFNEDTCRKVLEELMRWGRRVDGGETLGKTIIFAYNHKHAQMIVDLFREMYPQYHENYCQLVDYSVNYGEDLVIKFGEDPNFRIAVSVDMLDTGVDVPEVLNLVFFKKVRSRIKFVQMIGRGTRLCENVYGPGRNKSDFLIFDYCGNFEYFGEHPDGKEGKEVLTLSQRVYQIRLEMLYELQKLEYQEDTWLHAYYEKIKDDLHNEVVRIKGHDERIQVRESMQYVDKWYDRESWVCLSPVDVKEIKRHISPLLDSGLSGDHLSVSFDARMYFVERTLLATGKAAMASNHIKAIRLTAKFLIDERGSVPQVIAKANDLRQLAGKEYWDDVSVAELERMRESVRDLMPLLEGGGPVKMDVDIRDEITEADYVPDDTAIDIRTYREKVIDYLMEHSDSEVIRKIHNLEPINRADLDELEQILWHELGSREEYDETTQETNLAAFIRSLIGLNQEAVNEKFSDYLSGNMLNAKQQEFVRTIINYVRENGDVDLSDMVNTEPFNNYDLTELFGERLIALKNVVEALHGCIQAGAA